MAKMEPFYGGKDTDFYYVRSNCPVGRGIEAQDRKTGTGGGRMCQRCQDLLLAGECRPVSRHGNGAAG